MMARSMAEIDCMDVKTYRSGVEWWIWAVALFFLAVLIAAWIGGLGLMTTCIYLIGFGVLFFINIFGVRYVVKGDRLLVYRYFRPKYYPIRKIRKIEYKKGLLSGPVLSTKGVAISFSDMSAHRSFLPLVLSPKDRDGFVRHLQEINPDILISK